MSNCKLVIGYNKTVLNEKGKPEVAFESKQLQLADSFDPSKVQTFEDLFQALSEVENWNELLEDIKNSKKIKDPKDKFGDNQWANFILNNPEFTDKNLKFVPVQSFEESFNLNVKLDNIEIYSGLINQFYGTTSLGNVMVVDNLYVHSDIIGFTTLKSQSGDIMDIISRSQIEPYIVYKVVSKAIKDGNLLEWVNTLKDQCKQLLDDSKDSNQAKWYKQLKTVLESENIVDTFLKYYHFSATFKNNVESIVEPLIKYKSDIKLNDAIESSNDVAYFNKVTKYKPVISIEMADSLVQYFSAKNPNISTFEDVLHYLNSNKKNNKFYSIIGKDEKLYYIKTYSDSFKVVDLNSVLQPAEEYFGEGTIPIENYKGFNIVATIDSNGNMKYYVSHCALFSHVDFTVDRPFYRTLAEARQHINKEFSTVKNLLNYNSLSNRLAIYPYGFHVAPQTKLDTNLNLEFLGIDLAPYSTGIENFGKAYGILLDLLKISPIGSAEYKEGSLLKILSKNSNITKTITTIHQWQALSLFLCYLMTNNNWDLQNLTDEQYGELLTFIDKVSTAQLTHKRVLTRYTSKQVNEEGLDKHLKNYVSVTKALKNPTKENVKGTFRTPAYVWNNLKDHLETNFGLKVNLLTETEITELFAENADMKKRSLKSRKAFVHNGEIYINTSIAGPSTMVHELMHLMLGVLRVKNPKVYNAIIRSAVADSGNASLLASLEAVGAYRYNGKIVESSLAILDLLEELFVDAFTSNAYLNIATAVQGSNARFEICKLLGPTFDLQNPPSLDEVLNMTFNEICLKFSSTIINGGNEQINEFLISNDAKNERKISNAIAELKKVGILLENKDSASLTSTFTFCTPIKEDNKTKFVPSGLTLSDEELRDVIRNYYVTLQGITKKKLTKDDLQSLKDSFEFSDNQLEELGGDEKFAELFKKSHDILRKVSDVVFSTVDPNIENTITKLKAFSTHHVNTTSTEIDYASGNQVDIHTDSNYVSIYTYLQNAKELNGEPLISKLFDLHEYETKRREELAHSISDESQINSIIEAEKKGFTQSMKIAYNIHKIANLYFKMHIKSWDNFRRLVSYPEPVQRSIYKTLLSIEAKIKRISGDNYEIIPNIQLTAPVVGDSRKLVANVDLISINKDTGQITIFKFGSSSNLGSSYNETINERNDYILGFQRHMLASNGIPSNKINLYTVNLHIEKDLNGNLVSVSLEDINDRLMTANVSGTFNRLTWRSGYIFNKINERIPLTLSHQSITIPFKEDVTKLLRHAFSRVILRLGATDDEVKDFINSKRVFTSDKPEYSYMFIDYTQPPNSPKYKVYITDSSDKETNMELFNKVKDYLKRSSEHTKNTRHDFVNRVNRALNGEIFLSEAFNESPQALAFLEVTFRKYLGGDWEMIEHDALADFGIYLILNSFTGQVDIIGLSNINGRLNEKLNLGKGKTILGTFEDDRTAMTGDNMIKASKGNIELMKILMVLNLPLVASIFLGQFKIGQIKVINSKTGIGSTAGNKLLLNSFARLKEHLISDGLSIPDGLHDLEFMNPYELFKLNLYGVIHVHMDNLPKLDPIYSNLERLNVNTMLEMLDALLEIHEQMVLAYPNLLNLSEEDIMKLANGNYGPIVDLYILLWKCIYQCIGDFRQVDLLNKYSGTFKDLNFLNGTFTNNPGTAPDYNLRTVTMLARTAMGRITKRLTLWYDDYKNHQIKELWDAKGHNSLLNGLIGNLSYLYSNMFVKANGSINDRMILKDPSDPSLSPAESKFLKDFLWQVNSIRFNITNPNDDKITELKATGLWYWLPLVQADSSSKLQQYNVVTRLKNSTKHLADKLESFKQSGAEEPLYTESDYSEYEKGILNYKMFDLFSRSEISEDSRQNMLEHVNDANYWELNLETVLIKYKFAKIRKHEFDRVLPFIKGMRLLGKAYFEETGTATTRENDTATLFDEFLDKYMKVSIYNQTILNDETRYLSKAVSSLKFSAATLALGLNFIGGIRECIEGTWKTMGRISSKFYSNGLRFNKTDWAKAISLLLLDSPEFVKHVTLLEAICQRFRIANMDMNALADRIKSNKSGVLNAKDRLLFWFQTSPDYFNRMAMLVAQMIHDGCFDALSYDEHGLLYDWKKDKRFLHYAAGDINHPDYSKERAEYLSRLELCELDYGDPLKEGAKLDLPYTEKEIIALKDFSDITFGSYDHDVKALVEKTFAGGLMLQFKTYLSATKTTYFLKPDLYNLGERRLEIDELTGKPLYWHVRPDGTRYKSTVENGMPVTTNTLTFMRGIAWSIGTAFKAFKLDGLAGLKKVLDEDDVMQSGLKLFGYNMMIWLMLGAIVKYLISMWSDNRKLNALNQTITAQKMLEDEAFNVFSKSVIGSFGDFNLLTSFVGNISDSEPASIGILKNLFESTNDAIFGDTSLKKWFRTNSGLYRSVQGIGDNVYELIKTLQNY